MASNAIKGAAEAALEKWKDEERPALGTYIYIPPKTTQMDPEDGSCIPNFAYGYVAEVVELEVDIDTGKVRLLNVLCADDVGKAINPQMIEGQIGFVATPGGRLWMIDGERGVANLVCGLSCLPADQNFEPGVFGPIAKHYTLEQLFARESH